MQSYYTHYLKLADKYYLISTNDSRLADYLMREFWLIKEDHQAEFTIKVRKNVDGYIFEFGWRKSLKILFSDINHINYWKHIDFIIMLLINSYSILDNTLLFHGSAFAKNNRGYIFLGPTGAGKSTITCMVPKKQIYADDTVVVKKKGKRFFLYPSPFDRKRISTKDLNPAPVYRIYILNQSRNNKIADLKTEDKLAKVFKGLLLVEGFSLIKQNRQKNLYRLALDLVSRTKVYNLFFTKDFDPYRNLI